MLIVIECRKIQITTRTRPLQGSCPPKPATIVSKSGSILQKANSQPDISSRIRANSSPTNKTGVVNKASISSGPASTSKLSTATEISPRPTKFQATSTQSNYSTQRAPVTKFNMNIQTDSKPSMTLRALSSPRGVVKPPTTNQSFTAISPRTFVATNSAKVLSSPRYQHKDEAPPAAVSSPPSLSPRSPRSEPSFLPIKGTSTTVAKQGDSKTVPTSENEVILVKSTYKAESNTPPLTIQSVNPGAPKTPPSSGHKKQMSFNTMVAGIVGHDVRSFCLFRPMTVGAHLLSSRMKNTKHRLLVLKNELKNSIARSQ